MLGFTEFTIHLCSTSLMLYFLNWHLCCLLLVIIVFLNHSVKKRNNLFIYDWVRSMYCIIVYQIVLKQIVQGFPSGSFSVYSAVTISPRGLGMAGYNIQSILRVNNWNFLYINSQVPSEIQQKWRGLVIVRLAMSKPWPQLQARQEDVNNNTVATLSENFISQKPL